MIEENYVKKYQSYERLKQYNLLCVITIFIVSRIVLYTLSYDFVDHVAENDVNRSTSP